MKVPFKPTLHTLYTARKYELSQLYTKTMAHLPTKETQDLCPTSADGKLVNKNDLLLIYW